MGRCPTGTVPGNFPRGRKRGLQTALQKEIIREIETLLGNQSIADLDFEAVEMARGARLCARQRVRWNNDSTRTPAIMRDRNYPAPAEAPPSIMAVTERPSKAYWGLCTYSALTITVSNARADAVRGTGLWGWNRFR